MEFVTPEGYAAHLATYIASPTKIERLVGLEFDRVPPLREIADMRYRVEQAARRSVYSFASVRGRPSDDAIDWQPRTFVAKRETKPEPQPERERDYIIIETTPSNPFVGPFMASNLVKSVAQDFRFSVDEMCGERRHKPFVHARAVVARILKERGWSYPRIAHAIGRADHTTVINAVEKFDIYVRANPQVQQSYDRLSALMREADEAKGAEQAEESVAA